MGKIIPRSASAERIFTDFRAALKNGRKSGGEIKKVVEARLVPLEAGASTAVSDVESTTETVDDLEGTLFTVDGGSDLEIGAVLDEVWNALGRPASSVEYTLIAGRGKAQWTDGDPREQPMLMAILATRLRQSTAFALQDGKESWAQRIEAKAAAQQLVADSLKAAEAKHTVGHGHRARHRRYRPGRARAAQAGSSEYRADGDADSRHPSGLRVEAEKGRRGEAGGGEAGGGEAGHSARGRTGCTGGHHAGNARDEAHLGPVRRARRPALPFR